MKIIAFLFSVFYYSRDLDISNIRSMYKESVTNEKVNDKLIADLKDSNIELFRGYFGASTMMKAKHCLNPYKKLELFSDGKRILDSSIETDTTNLELRYLRLAIQENTPRFLNYHSMIERDKYYLSKNIESVINDDELKN